MFGEDNSGRIRDRELVLIEEGFVTGGVESGHLNARDNTDEVMLEQSEIEDGAGSGNTKASASGQGGLLMSMDMKDIGDGADNI